MMDKGLRVGTRTIKPEGRTLCIRISLSSAHIKLINCS